MSEQTKKEKPITRDNFITVWRNTARDLTSLADSVEEYDEIMDLLIYFVSRIETMLAEKWDALP